MQRLRDSADSARRTTAGKLGLRPIKPGRLDTRGINWGIIGDVSGRSAQIFPYPSPVVAGSSPAKVTCWIDLAEWAP